MSVSSTSHPNPLAIIHFLPVMVAIFRNAISAQTHQHHAAQITLDFEGDFELHCQGKVQNYKCVLIPPNASHCVRSNNHWQLTILLDAQSLLTKRLLKFFNATKQPKEIPEKYHGDLLVLAKQSQQHTLDVSYLNKHLLTVFNQWVGHIDINAQDARIEKLLNLLNTSTSLHEVDEILAQVPLSKSRLSHLFVEQAGVTLRRYLLWQRLRRAITLILAGKSITHAAYDASFSDLPHLSRTFKSMFGINISRLFNEKDNIHLHVE